MLNRPRIRLVILLGVCLMGLLLLISGNRAREPVKQGSAVKIRYFALGDSYTYGESVANHERWPDQFTAALRHRGISVDLVGNPSLSGYTTQDVITAQLPELRRTAPNFVTLLIGVNDYVRGMPPDTFRQRLSAILTELQAALPDPGAVIIVTIPDFGKTPAGNSFGDMPELERGITAYNEVIRQEAYARELGLADVFPASQRAAADSSLIATDGLHPSGKQYEIWTAVILDEFNRVGMIDRIR